MSGSYKIAIILAIVLCGGVVTYHLIQGADPGVAGPIDPGQPTPPKTIKPPSLPAPGTDQQPGVSDLMSRLRNHIEAVEKSKPIKPDTPPDRHPKPRTEPAHKVATRPLEPSPPTQPKTPTMTFGPAPRDVTVVNASNNRPDTPAPTTGEPSNDLETPPVNSTTAAVKAPRDYTVQPGDTFSSIAVKIYGSEKHWIDIAMANPFADPKKLKIGQSLRLPDIDEVQLKAKTDLHQPDAPQARTHIVRPGESLYSIADDYYNNADLWRLIFDANRTTLGADPDRLEAGEVIKIPPAPKPAP